MVLSWLVLYAEGKRLEKCLQGMLSAITYRSTVPVGGTAPLLASANDD